MKFPIDKILLGAVLIPWWGRRRFMSALLIPALLIAVLQLASSGYPGRPPTWLAWTVWGINILAYVVFAVICHRLVLIEGPQPRLPTWSIRETRFAGLVIAIGALSVLAAWAVLMVTATPVINIFLDAKSEAAGPATFAATWGGKIISAYVLARLSLVLPAAAVERPLTLAQSWAATRGNGWRLALVVGVLPWVMNAASGAIYGEGTGIESVAYIAVNLLALTVEVAALSLSYQQLVPGSRLGGAPTELPGPIDSR